MAGDKIFYDYGEHHVSYLSSKKPGSHPNTQKNKVTEKGLPYVKAETNKRNNYLNMTVAEQKPQGMNATAKITASQIRKNASKGSTNGIYGHLTVYNFDIATGSRLEGAVFELRSDDGVSNKARSSKSGTAYFAIAPGKRYVLREISSPEGYALNDTIYNVSATLNGHVKVNGRTMSQLVIPATRGASETIEDSEDEIIEDMGEPITPEFTTFYPQGRESNEIVTYGALELSDGSKDQSDGNSNPT